MTAITRLDMLEAELARKDEELALTRRDNAALQTALLDRDRELAYARPMADAAWAYLSALLTNGQTMPSWRALLAAHRATTPSKTRPSHVVVRVDWLAWRKHVVDIAEVVARPFADPGEIATLRHAIDDCPKTREDAP